MMSNPDSKKLLEALKLGVDFLESLERFDKKNGTQLTACALAFVVLSKPEQV